MLRTRLIRIAKHLIPALCAACVLFSAAAHASLIQFDTRQYTGGVLSSAEAYRTTIDNLIAGRPSAGYGDATLTSYNNVSNHALFGAGNNIAFRSEIDFNAASAGTWNFRIGPDFGLGGAVFLDGQLMGVRTNDMWWAGSYSNPSQIFSFSTNLSSGNHSLLIYGLEACCDGGQQAQFQAAGTTGYTTFSNQDGHNPNDVPEPGSLPLVAAASLGLMGLRRKAAR